MKNKYFIFVAAIVMLSLSTNSHAWCSKRKAKEKLNIGISYANQGDFGNAVNAFNASIECRKTTEGYSNLGAAYMQQGKLNLAMDALKRAEKKNKKNNVVMYNIAALHSLKDDTDLSLIYIDKALKHGFKQYDALRFDPDLSNVRGEPDFRKVLEKHGVFIQ